MASQFEPHRYPKRSRLEKWRDEITEMRALNWPCAKVVRWLLEHHNLEITDEAVRLFCIRRGISKGVGFVPVPIHTKTITNKVVKSSRKAEGAPKRLFEYDDSKPIDRWGKSKSQGGGQ